MEKFEIKNRKGLKIVGDILKPINPKGLGFVLHGLGGYKDQLHIKILADTLFENNYIVINFDATNSIGESEGSYENATMQNHYEDLADVINWAKTQTWYIEPFILAGHSLGGFAVAKYAEEFPQEVKGVFPYAAVYSGKDSFEASEKFKAEEIKEWKETGWTHKTSTSKPWVKMKLPWSHMEERLMHDLKLKVDRLTMPVLFVVGEFDTSCPPYQQKNFYDLLPDGTEREFHIIKGARHTFREPEQLNQLKEIFSIWLNKI
ncbi:MAG: alpha/beta fold hydrolase [Candidatus Paceibacterota bacterium]